MRILVAEDDLVSSKVLSKFLSKFAICDVAFDGKEALDAFLEANREGKPYDFICLDIMMPKIDGIKVLKAIRDLEKQKNLLSELQTEKRVKVIMTTALIEEQFIHNSFDIGCDAYAEKPIDLENLMEVMLQVGLSMDNI